MNQMVCVRMGADRFAAESGQKELAVQFNHSLTRCGRKRAVRPSAD